MQEGKFGQPLVSYCESMLIRQKVPRLRAVVFGCGVGYSAFLLTRTFEEVCNTYMHV